MNNDDLVDSASLGDPARHLPLDHLREALESLPPPPTDAGTVVHIMRRGEGGRREVLREVVLTPDHGVPGDAWSRQPDRRLDAQIAVMQSDVAELVANGQPLSLFGDCLALHFDLSRDNLPIGSRLQIGEALLVVTPEPHNGCAKYRARFGDAALRLVSTPELRYRNLRGIYLRVIEAGEVRTGDPVRVVLRQR